MQQAGISPTIIQILIAEQTSSVTPDFLISLSQAGANDKILEKIILGDRYHQPSKTNPPTSTKEILKSSGLPNAVIEELCSGPSVRTEKDSHGNERIIYQTGPGKKSTDTNPPASSFHINIEKVEKE